MKQYGTGPVRLDRFTNRPDSELIKNILSCAKAYKLETIARRGEAGAMVPVWTAADTAADPGAATSRSEKLALLTVLGRKLMVSEVDLLIQDGDELVPVSVWWETPGELSFLTGAKRKSILVEGITPEQIREKYGVGEFLEGNQKWDAHAYAAVARALALLGPEEVKLLKGLPFRRAHSEGQHRAVYRRANGTPRAVVDVYDSTFVLDNDRFMGEPSAPEADSVGVLLHELGHAIADTRMRELSWKALALLTEGRKLRDEGSPEAEAKIMAGNEQTRRLNGLDAQHDGRPAELEFNAVFDVRSSPTTYGKKAPREHFAECFKIFKADPAAFKRISPEAAAWFAAGNHLKIAMRELP